MRNVSGFGRSLSKDEQKAIIGAGSPCQTNADCPEGVDCINGYCGGTEGGCIMSITCYPV